MREESAALEEDARYHELVRDVRQVVAETLPAHVAVLVAADGDDELLNLGERQAWYFPRDERGFPWYPRDDREAIDHLEELRAQGPAYLIFPSTGLWWLKHYPGLHRHLEQNYRRVQEDESCVIYDLDPMQASTAARRRQAPLEVDIARSALHDHFFSRFGSGPVEDVLAQIAKTEIPLDSVDEVPGPARLGYGGWLYWFFYLKGYLEYLETGAIGRGNAYYEYLATHSTLPERDPGLSTELGNPLTTIERIVRRYRDLDYYHHPGVHNPVGMYAPEPVKLVVGGAPPRRAISVYLFGSDKPLMASRIDGHHRLFAARLFGALEFRCEVVVEDSDPGHVLGAIERFRFDGERLEVAGWALRAGREIESFEIRARGRTLARVGVVARPDVAEQFPEVTHAYRSGFELECECDLTADESVRFEVVPRADWSPVGAMTMFFLPGMFREREWPPAALAKRLHGETEAEALALRAAKSLYELLAPIERHRPLASFESVLNWGAGCGLLHVFLPSFVGNAEVTGIDTDAEGIEWCRRSDLTGTFRVVAPLPPVDLPEAAFDLVLGHTPLTRLGAEEQAVWLEEIARLVRPGGLVALTTSGELVRPFEASPQVVQDLAAQGITAVTPRGRLPGRMLQSREFTTEICARWFEVLDYVEGGVDDLLDLVVLRKSHP